MNQEQIMQMQMMEQEANQLNQQLEIIDQNIKEMQELAESLVELEKDDCKEILTNLGKKIYLPVEVKEKKLIVEVGNKNFVEKSVPETKKVLEEQIKKLMAAKTDIVSKLEDMQVEMQNVMMQLQQAQMEEQEKASSESEKESDKKEVKKDEDSIEDLAEGK